MHRFAANLARRRGLSSLPAWSATTQSQRAGAIAAEGARLDVDFYQFSFVDLFGVQRSKLVPGGSARGRAEGGWAGPRGARAVAARPAPPKIARDHEARGSRPSVCLCGVCVVGVGGWVCVRARMARAIRNAVATPQHLCTWQPKVLVRYL